MYNYLVENPIVALIFVAIVVVIAIFLFVKAMQIVGMEKIRGHVYKFFVQAEHAFKHGENEDKFEYVVCLARSAVPTPFDLFITENFMRKTIQLWFDICKDLLDDGKFNGTGKGE